ncbi:hypothetical protein Hanom_Chr11g01059501 [Helianthus anomalus]
MFNHYMYAKHIGQFIHVIQLCATNNAFICIPVMAGDIASPVIFVSVIIIVLLPNTFIAIDVFCHQI